MMSGGTEDHTNEALAEKIERAVFDAWAVREGNQPTADTSWWHIHRSGPTHTKWAADAAFAVVAPLLAAARTELERRCLHYYDNDQHYDHEGPHHIPTWRDVIAARSDATKQHQRADALAAKIEAVEAVCAKAEHGALRWEDPLPVPEWVSFIRAALSGVGGNPTPAEPAPLRVMQAHAAADCPDRDGCWAAAIHDEHHPRVGGVSGSPEGPTDE